MSKVYCVTCGEQATKRIVSECGYSEVCDNCEDSFVESSTYYNSEGNLVNSIIRTDAIYQFPEKFIDLGQKFYIRSKYKGKDFYKLVEFRLRRGFVRIFQYRTGFYTSSSDVRESSLEGRTFLTKGEVEKILNHYGVKDLERVIIK